MKNKSRDKEPGMDESLADDISLFREAMNEVRPLNVDERVMPTRKKPKPRPKQLELDEQQVLLDMLSDPVDPDDLETGEELIFCRTGIQHKTFSRLRRGEYAIEAELDLHGQFVSEAKQSIVNFLSSCRQRGLRCIRIIHGKGRGSFNKQPVLKVHVNHWLKQRNEVLAFCSARQVDGGTGAIYVLLKKAN